MSDTRITPPATPASNAPGSQHPGPEDLVLYAMQLLPADQSDAIDRHLPKCSVCRGELGRIHGDLAIVALTAETAAPSAAARERLLGQVAREKKIAAAPATKRAAPPESRPAPIAAAPRPLAEFGRGKGSNLNLDPVVIASRRTPPHGWAGWAAAAALAVVSGLL